jgi:hypothetical protein
MCGLRQKYVFAFGPLYSRHKFRTFKFDASYYKKKVGVRKKYIIRPNSLGSMIIESCTREQRLFIIEKAF